MGLFKQCLRGMGELLQRLWHSIVDVLGVAICYVYVAWWTISWAGRRILTESAIIVVLVASGMVFLEIASDLYRKHLELLPLPRWAEALVLLLAFWLVYHRYKEFRQMKKESVLAGTIRWLIEEIAQLDFIPGKKGNYEALQTFVHKVLLAFIEVYQPGRKPQINVMLKGNDGRLRIDFAEPAAARYQEGISFAPDEGGAGKAFSRGITIYFPAIRFRHGIRVVGEQYDLLETAYQHVDIEDFASVICTPVQCRGEIFGVLNVDSRRQNAFDMTDIRVAQVAANTIGLAIDRYRTGF